MKRQIRKGVFETNSSSTHSITMCTKTDFDKWKNGELAWSRWTCKLVPITDEIQKSIDNDERDYYTYDQFNDYDYVEYETFVSNFTPPNGETITSFGYYGYN